MPTLQWDDSFPHTSDRRHQVEGPPDNSSDLADFTLLVVEEFLRQHQFAHCLHALKVDLDQMKRPHPPADTWMGMYDRLRPFLGTLRTDHADWSLAECMVDFLLRFHDSYEPKTPSQSTISVLVSSPARNPLNRALVALPKKATLSLMDAFHAAQSPLKRPSQHTAPHSTSEPPEKKSTTNQDVPTPAAYTTSPACRKHIKQRSASDKRLQRKAVVQAIEVPPMTSSTSNGDDGGPLPKLKFDQTDWKRTSTTIKSIERGMREMRYETQFQDKQAKAMAKVLPAALPPSSVGRTASNDIAGASLPYYRALEQERFGASKRRECGLCHISHLTINLPAKVSFRCIMELYVRWGYVPPDRDSAKYRPPKCYDEVPICRFCEQIVQDVTWDPSFQKPFHSLPFVHHDDVASSGKRPSSLDPYALPPLDPDDFLSSGDDASDHEAQEQKPDVVHPDTPAKLVYRQANYLTGEKALSLNEWSVLQTSMSNIRVVMERTAKLANARNTKHL